MVEGCILLRVEFTQPETQVLTLRSRFSTLLHIGFLLSFTFDDFLHFPGPQFLYFGCDTSGALLS